MLPTQVRSAAVLICIFLAGCSGEPAGPPDGSGSIDVERTVSLDALGARHQLDVTVRDSEGLTVANPSIVWTIRSEGVVSMPSPGQLLAEGNGMTWVVGRAQSVSDSVFVTVEQRAAEILLAVDEVFVGPSGTVGLDVVGVYDRLSRSMAEAAPEWSSSDSRVAGYVDGRVEGRGVGEATLVATFDGVSAELRVVVREGFPGDVTLYSENDIAEFDRAAFSQVEGGLRIAGADIRTIRGLDGLVSVGGELSFSTRNLIELGGFSNLLTVGALATEFDLPEGALLPALREIGSLDLAELSQFAADLSVFLPSLTAIGTLIVHMSMGEIVAGGFERLDFLEIADEGKATLLRLVHVECIDEIALSTVVRFEAPQLSRVGGCVDESELNPVRFGGDVREVFLPKLRAIGRLELSRTDIRHLDLPELLSIAGPTRIFGNTRLETVTLPAWASWAGGGIFPPTVSVVQNPVLRDFLAGSLLDISHIGFESNEALERIFLPSLATAARLRIWDSPALHTLDVGLSAVEDIEIIRTSGITDLDTFSGIRGQVDSVILQELPDLEDVSGLESLGDDLTADPIVLGSLWFHSNPKLTSDRIDALVATLEAKFSGEAIRFLTVVGNGGG